MGKFGRERPKFENIGVKDAFEDYCAKNESSELSYGEYRAIMLRYFSIYTNELVFMKKPMYFPLTGKVMLNKCGNWIRTDQSNMEVFKKRVKKEVGHSLGFFWHHRPIQSFRFIRLIKSSGSTNRLPAIEKQWKEANDITLLKKSSELKKIKSMIKPYL